MSDNLFEYVSLLIGFEDVQDGQDFEDESSYAHSLSVTGAGPKADTTIFAAGASSGYFDGSNSRMTVPSHESFELGAEDFVLETFIYCETIPSGEDMLCAFAKFGEVDGWIWAIDGTDLVFYRTIDGASYTRRAFTMPGFAIDTLYHIGVQRWGDRLQFLFEGTVIGAVDITGSITVPAGDLYIGTTSTFTNDFKGYLDELRLTVGGARYLSEASYTVPTLPFPRSGPGAGDPIEGAEAPTITLACFLRWELPERNVLLCDGGFLKYNSETYYSTDSEFGSLHTPGTVDTSFGDFAESGEMVLAPTPDAPENWWRDDLRDGRLRIWIGNVDPDGVTVGSATLLADMLVDTYERRQSSGGEDMLSVELMSRAEKLFLVNEGNVLSQRFHQTIWPGEKGLNNCTDLIGYLAWGAATPPRGSTSGGGGFSGTLSGGSGSGVTR